MIGLGLAINSGEAASSGRSALNALAQARSRRVDVLLVGDSNAAHNGYGFWGGLQKQLAARFGTYASPINGIGSASVSNLPVAHGNGIDTNFVSTGAPASQAALFPGYTSSKYGYLPDATTLSGSGNATVTVNNITGGLDIAAALRSHLVWGSFATGAGSFKLSARLGYSPYTTLATSPLIGTNTGETSLHRTTMDIPADATRHGSIIEANLARAATLTGPFFGVAHRVENPAKTNGVCVSTLDSTAGWSLYDMASDMRTAADSALSVTLGEARYLQLDKGQSPIVVIALNSGMNDRNETATPSLGPNPSNVADSAAAYIDNLNALVARVEGIYTANGWSLSGLYWLLFPSHPVSDPDDAKLVSYRAAATSWAASRPRASCVVLTDYINSETMTADSYYYFNGTTTEYEHLSNPSGYDAISQIVVDRIP